MQHIKEPIPGGGGAGGDELGARALGYLVRGRTVSWIPTRWSSRAEILKPTPAAAAARRMRLPNATAMARRKGWTRILE